MVITFVAYLYKMKRLHLFFLLFASSLAHAQSSSTLNDYEVTIDSLKNAISTSKSDSLRCIMNYRLAYIYTKNVDKPLIRDLIIEGLSLARTQKEEFASILNSNDGDINALFKSLEKFSSE